MAIREFTHLVTFSALLNINNDTPTAPGKIIVEGIRCGIKFHRGNIFKGHGDVLVRNDFDLNVHITANIISGTI